MIDLLARRENIGDQLCLLVPEPNPVQNWHVLLGDWPVDPDEVIWSLSCMMQGIYLGLREVIPGSAVPALMYYYWSIRSQSRYSTFRLNIFSPPFYCVDKIIQSVHSPIIAALCPLKVPEEAIRAMLRLPARVSQRGSLCSVHIHFYNALSLFPFT